MCACSVTKSCLTLCDPMDSTPPADFPGKNTGVGCYIFGTKYPASPVSWAFSASTALAGRFFTGFFTTESPGVSCLATLQTAPPHTKTKKYVLCFLPEEANIKLVTFQKCFLLQENSLPPVKNFSVFYMKNIIISYLISLCSLISYLLERIHDTFSETCFGV